MATIVRRIIQRPTYLPRRYSLVNRYQLRELESEDDDMNLQKLRQFVKFLLGGLLMILIFTFVALSMRSLPSTSAGGPYPGPDSGMVTPTPSETICDKWFSYFNELPSDKRAIAEEEYKNCLEAIKTPSTLGMSKPIPATPVPGGDSSPFLRREAGFGTIVETSFSPLPSFYVIKNQWYSEQNGKQIIVFAGAQRSDPLQGEKSLDKPWPGLLIVAVNELGGKFLSDEGGKYWTPTKVGPVRIVEAEGMNLTLAAEDGTVFVFDVSTRQFISTVSDTPISRMAGAGDIVESRDTPFYVDGYDFVNYWTESRPEIGTITVMVGAQSNNPEKGVLVIVVSPLEDKNTVLEEVAYLTPIKGGALRIVEADGEILTIVSEDGLIYVFDVQSRQFLSLPSSSTEAVTVIPLVADSSEIKNTLTPTSTPALGTVPVTRQPTYTPTLTSSLPTSTRTPTRTPATQNTLTRTPTRTNTPQNTSTRTSTHTPTKTSTPTRTPTPRPSSTALPTYNPYP